MFVTISTKFSQNRPGFVDDVAKTFGVFLVRNSNCCSLTKRERQFSQGSVVTLFRWAGKRLDYCITILFRTMCTKVYQNWLGFVEDMTKPFGVIFGSQYSWQFIFLDH